jgi:hypothetical protein
MKNAGYTLNLVPALQVPNNQHTVVPCSGECELIRYKDLQQPTTADKCSTIRADRKGIDRFRVCNKTMFEQKLR